DGSAGFIVFDLLPFLDDHFHVRLARVGNDGHVLLAEGIKQRVLRYRDQQGRDNDEKDIDDVDDRKNRVIVLGFVQQLDTHASLPFWISSISSASQRRCTLEIQ